MDITRIFTDGSSIPKSRAKEKVTSGGYAVVAVEQGEVVWTRSEGVVGDEGTIGRMELLAVIEAVVWSLSERPDKPIIIHSDSQYVVKGFNRWVEGWKLRGWQRSTGGDVQFRDMWELGVEAREMHGRIRIKWVKGHAGNKYNEIADELAGEARKKVLKNYVRSCRI